MILNNSDCRINIMKRYYLKFYRYVLNVAPKRIKRYSSLQTVKNNAPPKPSYNLLEDLLSAGLIIGGAYLLGNALSSPSNAVAPSTTIINKIKPNNNLIYGPYDTPFGY